jgi:hypothetical protein
MLLWPDKMQHVISRYNRKQHVYNFWKCELTIDKWIGKKVKVTIVQALRLCTGCTTHSGNRGIAVPFLDHVTSKG